MRVTVLGSGSGGNATLVEAGDTRVLIDAGFSGRSIERRLRAVDVEPETLAGIVITHDHSDHTHGMGVMARRFSLPLYLTPVTEKACSDLLYGRETLRHYEAMRSFRIGPLEFSPFLTVHDAADPIAVTARHVDEGHKLGIATDLGQPTAAVRHALSECHMLVLESNHDKRMLWEGPYPWSVKRRIASNHGHLSNRVAAELARDLHHEGLSSVVLAHLSEHCNDPGLARDVVGEALESEGYDGMLDVARQDAPIDPVDVGAARRRGAAEKQLSLF